MKKHFYSHIIEIDTIHTSLREMDLSDEERNELGSIAETTIHHVVIDVILTELSPGDKKRFLMDLKTNHHPNIWTFLTDKIENIEDKIKHATSSFMKELQKDIEEAKSKK